MQYKLEEICCKLPKHDIHEAMEDLIAQSHNLKRKIDRNNRRMVKTISLVNKTILETAPTFLELCHDLNDVTACNTTIPCHKKPSALNQLNQLLTEVQPLFAEFVHLIRIPSQISSEINKLVHVKNCILKAKLYILYSFMYSLTNTEKEITLDGKLNFENVCEDLLKDKNLQSNINLPSVHLKKEQSDYFDLSEKGEETYNESTSRRLFRVLLQSDSFSNKGFVFANPSSHANTFKCNFSQAKTSLFHPIVVPFRSFPVKKDSIKITSKAILPNNLFNIFSSTHRSNVPPELSNGRSQQANIPDFSQMDRSTLLPIRSAYSPLWFTSMNRFALGPGSQRPILFNQPIQHFKNSAFTRPQTRLKLKHNQSKLNKKCLIPKGQKNSEFVDAKFQENSLKNDSLQIIPIKLSKNNSANKLTELNESCTKWENLKKLCSLPCKLLLINKNIMSTSCQEVDPKNLIVPYHSFKWLIIPIKSSMEKTLAKKKEVSTQQDVSSASRKKDKLFNNHSSFYTGSSDSIFNSEVSKLDAASQWKPTKLDKKKKKDTKPHKGQIKEGKMYKMVEIIFTDCYDKVGTTLKKIQLDSTKKNSCHQIHEQFQLQVATCQPPPAAYRINRATTTKLRKKYLINMHK